MTIRRCKNKNEAAAAMPEGEMPPLVAFVGATGVGKTGLLCRVSEELRRRGRKIAIIKHTHKEVETDTPGKDSWRFKEAGVDAVVLNSPSRYVLSVAVEERANAADLCALLPAGTEIVLMEGLGRDRGRALFPVLHVAGDGPDEKDVSGENVVALIGGRGNPCRCPRFRPEQAGAIADFLESRFLPGGERRNVQE